MVCCRSRLTVWSATARRTIPAAPPETASGCGKKFSWNVDGSFTVTWIDAGEPRAEVFRTETGAIRFATLLDTTGSLPTEQDVVAAEVAIRELERAAFPETPSERRAREAAERSLAELEQSMEEMEAQEQLESLRPYAQRRGQRVRKHARRAN